MNIPQQQKPRNADIDMVPMINFAFLLLIFVILAGSISRGGALTVHPPLSTAETHGAAEAGALAMAADGGLLLAGEAVSGEELATRAARWREQHQGAALQLRADAALPATRVLEVLETLRASGIAQVSLLTLHAP